MTDPQNCLVLVVFRPHNKKTVVTYKQGPMVWDKDGKGGNISEDRNK